MQSLIGTDDIFEMAAAAAEPETLIVIDDDDDDDGDNDDGNRNRENENEDETETNISRDLIKDDSGRPSRNNTEQSPSPPLFTPESQRRHRHLSPPPQKQQNIMTLTDGNNGSSSSSESKGEGREEKEDPIKYSLVRDSGVGMCGICFCSFDEDGHLMSCLRCGHIFGKSCIVKWLNSKPRAEKVCPICKAKSNPSQILVLYSPQLTEPSVPPDENENRKLRLEIIEAKRQNFLLYQSVNKDFYRVAPNVFKIIILTEFSFFKNEQLKREIAEAREQYEQLKTQIVHDRLFGGSSSSSTNQRVYRRILDEGNQPPREPKKSKSESFVNQPVPQCLARTRQNFEISGTFGAVHTERVNNGRVVEYFERESVLFYSTEYQTGKFGITMHSLLDTGFKTRLNITHSGQIRDMAANNDSGLIVTASSDKTLKLCRVETKNEVMECHTPADIWSCCWDANDPRYFYCGRKDGEVCLYDSRKTESFVCSARTSLKMPVHSLYSLRMPDGEVGLIVGSTGGISYVYGTRAGIADAGVIQRDKCVGISKPYESFGQTLIAASFRAEMQETVHRAYIIEPRVTHHKVASEILEPAFEFKNNVFSPSLGKPTLVSGHNGQTFLVTNNGPGPELVMWSLDDDGKPAFIKSSLDEKKMYPGNSALNILSFEKNKMPYFASITTNEVTIFGNIL